MLKREFEPLKAIGPLKFGMTIEEVSQVMWSEGKKFFKYENNPCYIYNKPFMHLYYKDGWLDFIEIFTNVEIYYKKIKLFPNDFLQVLYNLRNIEFYPIFDDVWFKYDKLWVEFYSEDRTENKIEAIDFFREWYYDK